MLEAAARAIAKARWPDLEWDELSSQSQEIFFRDARACISAIRVPSEAVTDAALELLEEGLPRSHFTCVIDAILADKTGDAK